MNTQKKILIVNDNPYYVRAIKTMLESPYYSVEEAYTFDEGFDALNKGGVDLLILDMMMEYDAEGILFAVKVRKDTRFSDLPLLMTMDMERTISFFPEGKLIIQKFPHVSAILEKPITVERLLDKVDSLLGSKMWH
ncbi:MAG: response regulator [bacterium]